MARFSVLTVLVTVYCFLLWTTQVDTPSHLDISLQMIEVLPLVKPILTISAPPPTRSPCAGINRCDKAPTYKIWASKFVGSANQARGYLNVYNFARPYLLKVGHFVHQVTDMLGRPTPDSLLGLVIMPTTGKLAAPPLGWVRVETPPPPPRSPPPPPTRTLPVYASPTPTTGPWNPPTPTTGYSRPRSVEPVVKTDSDHWFQQAMFIGSSLILTILSFVRNFKVALSLVKCVEHRDTNNGGTASRCDTICPVVPPKTEASATQAPRKSSVELPFEKLQNHLEASLGTPAIADSELLVDATSNRNLDLVPNYVVPLVSSPLAGISHAGSQRELGVALRRLLHPNLTLYLINRTISLIPTKRGAERRGLLLIEWYPTQYDAAKLLVAACPPFPLNTIYTPSIALVLGKLMTGGLISISPRLLPPTSNVPGQGIFGRSTPLLLLEWYPQQKGDAILPLEVVESSPLDVLRLTAEHPSSSTTRRPYHLSRALTPSSYAHSIPTPNLDHTTNLHHPPYRLLIECHAPPRSPGEVEASCISFSLYCVILTPQIIQPNSPPTPKVPLRIPPSFYRYANVRLEDLDGYPPEERDRILRREIQIAEGRYRLEKPRRDRNRFKLRLMRSEMKQKDERRKCEEEIEDEEEMERVIRARHLVQEEVFEGMGGPPPPVPEWLLDFFDMLKRDSRKKNEKERKGILKKGGEVKRKGKKSKVVKWMDESFVPVQTPRLTMSGSEDENMMDLDDVPQRTKKFTFRSYEAQLRDVHAPAKVAPLIAEHNVEDNQSHFQVSLEQWRQLNLSPNFISFANRASVLSGSMAMLLHHWEEVVSLWIEAVGVSDDEGLKPMIELSTCLIYDLQQILLPVASQLLEILLGLLPRKLPPDSLELLLTALTTHLKYLVITNPASLESMWSSFLRAASDSTQPPHVRMLAEVWGHLLRKLKKPEKEQVAQLLVASLGNAPEFVTWCVVEATRAKQAQGIYTTATELISPILDLHVGGSDGTYILLRRVLTALIHHSKTESFAGIASVVVVVLERELGALESEVKAKGKAKEDAEAVSQQEERLLRVAEIATVMCAVRKGGKLSQQIVSKILTTVPRIFACSEHSRARPEYRALIVAGLVAGDMGSWIGPGRRVLDCVWKDPLEGMRLSAILSELGWGGWKSMMLSHVLRRTPEILASHRSQCLSILATLYKAGHLEVDAVWTARVGSDVVDGLRKWNIGDSDTDLLNMLVISPILPSAATGVARIVSLLHSAQTNDSSLGASIRALVELEGAETALRNETNLSLLTLVERWWWSQSVMGALVQFQTLLASVTSAIPLNDLLPHLLTPLTSHSHTLRSSTLQLLAGPCVTRSPAQTTGLSRIIAAENTPLTVQSSRERVVKTGKVISASGEIEGDDMHKIAIRWLVAQLKVNLRPLWAPAIQTLGTLVSASRCGDEVWDVVYSELERVCRDPDAFELRSPRSQDDQETNDVMEVDAETSRKEDWEEERTWRCPAAIKCVQTVRRWQANTIPSVAEPTPQDRLDLANYESQLLLALGGMPSLMDKHTRVLVPLFFDHASPTAPSRPPRAKTISWLTLLSKLNNPKAAFRSQELHGLYTTLLSHPDRPLQSLALTCLLTFRESHVLAVEQSLRLFLDTTKWRDEMTGFSFDSLDGELRTRAVEVTIRLLYGSMLEKNRRDKKSAVLTLLSGCSPQEMGTLVRLMLAPFEDCLDGGLENAHTAAGGKQRTGFLTFLADVLKNLGPKLLVYWPQLLRTTMVLLRDAQAHCKSSVVPTEEEVDESEEPTDEHTLRQARSIRQIGLKRFIDFFRSATAESFDFSPYLSVAFQWFISPRVPLLARENTQAPSGILDLFYTWSMEPRTTLYLIDYDSEVLPQVFNCLTAVNVKPVVISRVFDIVEALLEHSEVDGDIKSRIVAPHTSHLLVQLSAMVERSSALTTTTDLVQRQLRILCQVAPYISDESQASRLLLLLSPMLRRPARMVSEKVKVDLLGIVKNTFPFVQALKDPSSAAYRTTYELVSSMFQSLRTRPGRVAIVEVFTQLAKFNEALVPLAHIVTELNAYSVKRMDEPDFNRRLTAFGTFNEEGYKSLTCELWLPLIYNMLFFIQDPDELSIRSSAALSLKRFVEEVAAENSGDFEKSFTKVVYPGLRYGMRSKFELVRTEILGVIAHAVARCDSISSLAQLRPLLADGDDEANFFLNIYHIQTHRRTRALRRLADFAENIRSTTLSDLFMPLVGQFVESVATTDHLLVNEAITTLGRMAAQLAWGSYNAAVQYYLRLARERVSTTEKAMIRTVVSILDNFHFKMGESVEVEKPETEEGAELAEMLATEAESEAKANAEREAKKMARVEEAVTTRLLPNLLQYLEKRDEAEEAIRIPMAIGIARVTMHLPDTYRGLQISKLIVALSQILRSKSQDVRNLTRETLCKIAIIVGPASLSLLIKELRGALARGPQLHVLAFVIHSILVHVTTGDHAPRFSVLDDCVSDIAHISAEVVFGQSGKDVQAEGFKTKLREVKSSASKGLDSFMIIAKYITAARIATLLAPIRSIMHETVAIKPMQQAEDVLRRIASGLNANVNLQPADTIVLCHTLISQNANFLKQKPAKKQHRKKTDFDVELKRNMAPESDFYASNSFRFIAFGLEILVTGFRRGRFDYADPEIISRLEPMAVVVGNTLYSQDGHVVTLGLKAAALIVKCPLRSVDKSLPVFVKQILEIIRSTGGTESEVVQTALKSLAIMIRDCPAAKLQESDLTFLLEVITPDLEEPERQAAVFSLLRAIIARKFVVPEIYDLMGKVAEILVTNQSSQVQELARSVLLQFLLDYPQGKGRLRTQLNALARNLDYTFDSGRKSVMELLAAVFSKFTDAIIDEYADMFFVALVLRIANDDSTKCREMAAALIQQLLGRVGDQRRKTLMVHVHNWAEQEEKEQLAAVAAQVYGLALDVLHASAQAFVSDMATDLLGLIRRSAYRLNDESNSMDLDEDDSGAIWQVSYHALTTLGKLYREFPEQLHSASPGDWAAIYSHLAFPHAWVRLASCRLVGSLFASIPISVDNLSLDADLAEATIFNPTGSTIALASLVDVTEKLCLQLRSIHLDDTLSTQAVKNLFYVGKVFALVYDKARLGDSTDQGDESGTESDPEDEEDKVANRAAKALSNPLAWMFSKLSYQARSAHIARLNKTPNSGKWHVHIGSIFRWFAAMASHLPPLTLETFLPHILAPVYRIAEEDTIKDAELDNLKTLTHELQALLQQRTGTTAFANAYSQIRQGVVRVRQERKIQRATQAATHPETAARRRLQRNIAKKEGKKRKDRSFADAKIRNNTVKKRRRTGEEEDV
ncbi:U3 snoRNP protein Utp20, partial [Rhizoctonia solani AG-3 Rhs1AP]